MSETIVTSAAETGHMVTMDAADGSRFPEAGPGRPRCCESGWA